MDDLSSAVQHATIHVYSKINDCAHMPQTNEDTLIYGQWNGRNSTCDKYEHIDSDLQDIRRYVSSEFVCTVLYSCDKVFTIFDLLRISVFIEFSFGVLNILTISVHYNLLQYAKYTMTKLCRKLNARARFELKKSTK